MSKRGRKTKSVFLYNWPCRNDNTSMQCSVREALLQVQRNQCFYCMRPLLLSESTLDHIVPVAKGGTAAVTNLVASCYSCNQSKADKEVSETLLQSRISFFNR
jgi:5-methylcytosine-specific restriction endonuclease McrA